MEIRLVDLYELIVRIVEDRLKHQREIEKRLSSDEIKHLPITENTSKHLAGSEEQGFQNLCEQLANLINLQRQLIEVVRTNQQRTEAILNELLKLLHKQIDKFMVISSSQANFELNGLDSEKDMKEKQNSAMNLPKSPSVKSPEATHENKSLSSYAIMALPEEIDYEVPLTPSDKWSTESPSEPVLGEIAPDRVSASGHEKVESSDVFRFLMERLPECIKRLFGVEVNYLYARQVPSSPTLQEAQIFVGEGFLDGQTVTLTIFGKQNISSADVTVFYNAIVKTLRSSMTEPVMSIVFGETFEPKALKVAHIFDLIVVNLKDLRNLF